MNVLETQIDALYALPLAEFTAARNALAKSLKGPDGAAVKRLEKPAAVAWAVNQLYWSERQTYEQLMVAGQSLRQAQLRALSGDTGALSAATSAHRDALTAAAAAAAHLAETRGTRVASDVLTRMLEALSLRPTLPTPAGRLVDLVQPAGLEALAGLATASVLASPPASQPKVSARESAQAEAAAREQERARRAAARAAASAALRQATSELEHARAARERADALVALTRQQFDNATRSLRETEAGVARAEAALANAVQALDALPPADGDR